MKFIQYFIIGAVLVCFSCEKKVSTDNLTQGVEKNTLEIALIGTNDTTITLNSDYNDPGVEVTGGHVYNVINSVNTKIVGNYSVKYLATNDFGVESSAVRSVKVRE